MTKYPCARRQKKIFVEFHEKITKYLKKWSFCSKFIESNTVYQTIMIGVKHCTSSHWYSIITSITFCTNEDPAK